MTVQRWSLRPGEIEWSVDTLADLDRFAAFLHDQFPELAARVAGELVARTNVRRRHPQMGRPLENRHEYWEIVLTVVGGTYGLQYRYDGSSILMLRVFHGRELRCGHRLALNPGDGPGHD